MSLPRRIAYLVSRYPAISHTFILREVQQLRNDGLEIEVASVNRPDHPEGRMTELEKSEQQRTFYVKQSGALRAALSHLRFAGRHPGRYFGALAYALRLAGLDLHKLLLRLFYFAEAVVVVDWMRRRRLDHLHVHFLTPASTVALIVKRLQDVSLSFMAHGPDEFYEATTYHLREKVEAADFVCCIGQFARSQLMKLSSPEHWHKLEVTPLGVDPEIFEPRPLKAPAEQFEILCVGRLVPAKGQHVLLHALRRLADRSLAVRLRLVGDGPDRDSLERLARELAIEHLVSFEGAVDQSRIRDFYRRADAFVLPSFAEGIPVVLMEAMSMQIPCVTTRITGIPELIRDGEDGLLVAPSDEAELADVLARLIADGRLRDRLALQGRQRVLERYHLQTNTARLAEVYRARIEPSAAAPSLLTLSEAPS